MDSSGTNACTTLEADLVVIGGGGAGMAAATAAAELGAKAVVLEKRGLLGGNSIRAGNIFACESPVQKREMVLADRDELFQMAMDWAHWDRVEPTVVRAFIDKSGDTIRWFQAKGVDFVFTPLYPNQLRVGHHPSDGGGRQIIETLAAQCESMGVRVMLGTGATRIGRSDDGAVVEVLAVGSDQAEVRIRSSSVIVASGGFGGNPDLLKKYCPAYYEGMRLHGVPHKGDGLLMAEEAGAAIADSIPILKEGPNPDFREVLSLKLFVCEPYTVWVNKVGRRFINEYAGRMIFESGNAILRQPDKLMFTLFDSEQRKIMETKTPPAPKKRGGGEGGPKGPEVNPADLAKTLEFYQTKDLVKIADSWEEIAEWIGAEPEELTKTIEAYNEACEQGYDADFVKNRRYLSPLAHPPYYAIRCATTFLDTVGGIKVNERMEVLDAKGTEIPGLYAAGVIADGHQPDTYCAELCGSAFGFALNSGRIAGENAAGFVLNKVCDQRQEARHLEVDAVRATVRREERGS
jgi:fumarate reductase flavoprotein subunit